MAVWRSSSIHETKRSPYDEWLVPIHTALIHVTHADSPYRLQLIHKLALLYTAYNTITESTKDHLLRVLVSPPVPINLLKEHLQNSNNHNLSLFVEDK